MFYRQKMKERSIELLEQELFEKERENKLLSEQNDILRVESHKINHRLLSLERSVTALIKNIQNNSYSTEFSGELSIAIEDIKRLSQEYQEGVARIKRKKPLPSTKLKILDDLFEYFSTQYVENNIEFNLKISGSIPYMAEHIIPQNKLATMIGDHLQDALIAVNASDNPFRNILMFLGLVGEYYELTVFDSGIPFEEDTLIRLGKERVTTHADTGGSGIGFMTTFETMRECGASLIIHEKKPSVNDYSKSVTIRFDGRNQYIIKTYRADNFSSSDERYIVIDLS